MAVATPCGRTFSKICGRRNAFGTHLIFRGSRSSHTRSNAHNSTEDWRASSHFGIRWGVCHGTETSKFIWNRLFLFFSRDTIFIFIQIMQYRTCWTMFTVHKTFRHTSVKSPFATTHFSFITAIKEIRSKKKKNYDTNNHSSAGPANGFSFEANVASAYPICMTHLMPPFQPNAQSKTQTN